MKYSIKTHLINESSEDKLIQLFVSADHENIIQALHLADGIDLIEITFEEEYARNWRGSYNCKFTVLSETFAGKLKEIAFGLSKGYSLTFGSNTKLTVDDQRNGEVWIRRDDHYIFSDENTYKGW